MVKFLDEMDATAHRAMELSLKARPHDAFAQQMALLMDYYNRRLGELPVSERAMDKTHVIHELMRHIAGFAVESPDPEKALEVLTANLRVICGHLRETKSRKKK